VERDAERASPFDENGDHIDLLRCIGPECAGKDEGVGTGEEIGGQRLDGSADFIACIPEQPGKTGEIEGSSLFDEEPLAMRLVEQH